MKRLIPIAAACFITSTALATPPDEQLSDPALEAQAQKISKGLRCLVCQNQSIEDSDAELAKDLRRIVRERLEAGDDEAAIHDFVVERYGEFILLKPRLTAGTALLWASPILFLLLGIGFAGYRLRRTSSTADMDSNSGLSDADKNILDQLRDK